ncbi:protease 2 [Ricinus communis]|uniref:Prolyl endopeptidase n=1 Tax=Ricinus communis TaxID=3988 RepID=B9RGI7_RICCO|nr:protease 2 [Ricinus communis]EEF49642.1 oligopeptidase B, putative [Ricinus communis]|eukprot:XP_002513139.1 uncharacterized protein LOC8260738 [Ricinus communis]
MMLRHQNQSYLYQLQLGLGIFGRRSVASTTTALALFSFSSLLSLPPNIMSMSMSPPLMKSAPVPVAKKVDHVMEKFGDVRVDHYYWLRDDSRSNADVLSYLQQENAYADSIMSGSKPFEQQLFAEIRGRIKEDDISAPRRKGPYYYYTRTLEGKEYSLHCRRFIPTHHTTPPSVHDVMPTGPNAPPEHVLLDENVNAHGLEFYKIGAFKVSPNHKLVAYAQDTKGDEIYTVHVIDADTKSPVAQPLTAVTSSLAWAGNDFLVYTTMDDIHRADKVWLHKLGTDQSSDSCLYHEKDEKFSLSIQPSESEQYLFVVSDSKLTSFVLYMDVSKPQDGAKVLMPRVDGTDTSVSHRGNHFFIRRRTDDLFNSELVACPVDNISATTVLIPHRESVKIWDAQVFADHLVVYERENGLPKIMAYHFPPVDEPLLSLKGGHPVEFIDPIYTVDSEESEFSSSILRFSYSSLRTPHSVYEYDMNTGISVLKKIDTVLGFDSSNYVTERKWARASDGTQIPLSVVYRKNRVKLDGSDPLLLYGYGSYEMSIDPTFRASRLSLLDRGFIFAIAHVRGGGEMGRQWYENGKFLKKKNTFTDFITCAEYLIEQNYCSKEKFCIEGRSAGGLLIGSVLNMRPDLFKAAVAGVPFVDVLTTMLDPSIPLTTEEWEEWGDPREEEFYFYMKSYSPVDNVKPQNYPHILVTAGLHDSRVMYSEPAKFVAKLRDVKTDDNLLLFKCELGAGHFSKSGRFERLQEDAFRYTFLLKVLNMIPDLGSGQKL